DIQTREVIVDNDMATDNSEIIAYRVKPDTITSLGFAIYTDNTFLTVS
ncbi:unnamed protein product, partial [marine sediment metagenome]